MSYQNFFAAKLYNDIGSGDTTITLDTAPTATSGRMVLEARNPTQREIISYTGVSGNQLTGVTRGVGGTTAKSHLKNALVEMNLTAQDLQDLYDAFLSFSSTNGSGWFSIPNAVSVASGYVQGRKLYKATFMGVNLTNLLQPYTKMKFTRSSAPGTQSMRFDSASSQQATRVTGSVTGALASAMTNFTIEANLHLEAYPNSTAAVIQRFDMLNNGWGMRIRPNGCIDVFYGTGGAFTIIDSYNAIPLRTDTHVAAAVNCATKSISIYIDGELQTATSTLASGATTMTAAGDIRMGFDQVYMTYRASDVRVWSTTRTQLQIQDNMHQELVGNEAGLVGYWKGNGNFNDSTASGNHLTASNGAIATYAWHPFKLTQYVAVMDATYTGGNTEVILYGGKTDVLPNMTLSSPSYSPHEAPFGFPIGLQPKTLGFHIIGQNSARTSVATVVTMPGFRVPAYVPDGARIRVKAIFPQVYTTADGVRHDFGIREDGSRFVQTQYERIWLSSTGGNTLELEAIFTPSKGSHYYEITFYQSNATATVYALANPGTFGAQSTSLAYMIIDIV